MLQSILVTITLFTSFSYGQFSCVGRGWWTSNKDSDSNHLKRGVPMNACFRTVGLSSVKSTFYEYCGENEFGQLEVPPYPDYIYATRYYSADCSGSDRPCNDCGGIDRTMDQGTCRGKVNKICNYLKLRYPTFGDNNTYCDSGKADADYLRYHEDVFMNDFCYNSEPNAETEYSYSWSCNGNTATKKYWDQQGCNGDATNIATYQSGVKSCEDNPGYKDVNDREVMVICNAATDRVYYNSDSAADKWYTLQLVFIIISLVAVYNV